MEQLRKEMEEKMKATLELQKKIKVDQVKQLFKSPADKRGVGFLTDLDFDVDDFCARVKALLPEDNGKVTINEDNSDKFVVSFRKVVAALSDYPHVSGIFQL